MRPTSRGQSQQQADSSQAQSIARWAVVIGSGALAVYGLTRRSKRGLALAAASGALAVKTARNSGQASTFSSHATLAINCSPQQAYSFWRNFENLPRFMSHLESVKCTVGNCSEWTATGPAGYKIRWTAETIEDRDGECISWHSLPGSDVHNSGSVVFRPGPGGRGTLVTVRIEYAPPAGPLGHIVARLFGKNPQFTVREDLRHFKSLIETGEVATTQGQSHGPRGIHGNVERVLFREPQNQLPPQEESALRRTA
jgi:uncharacterized membrane protein